jgi:hypothetical protein
MLMRPSYPHEPIGSIDVLSKVFGLEKDELIEIANNSNQYFFVAKKVEKEGKSVRLTYDVKPELKRIHEKICRHFLKKVDYPNYIQGGVKGKDYVSNCRIHSNKKVVLKEDVSNFFPSISKKIIYEVWTGFFNFPNEVAQVLAELVTLDGRLVQGGKASGFLCNLIFWEREPKLVSEFAQKGYVYTRFVDDITVSCTRNISKDEQQYIIRKIYGMLKSVDANPNKFKHKVMSNGVKQQLHNVNLNAETPTLPKAERLKIKTAVFQCEKEHGSNMNPVEYKKLFDRTMGRVNTLCRMHPEKGKALKIKLRKVKPK